MEGVLELVCSLQVHVLVLHVGLVSEPSRQGRPIVDI